jgi:hypothetical protein
MTINRELAEDCGLDESAIQEIESLHEKLDTFIAAWIKEPYKESRREGIHAMEYRLQELWQFPKDCSYHRYADLYEFRCQWAGKKYRCQETGEEFTIPDDVKPCDFFCFGQCSVDVGRLNSYSRMCGPIIDLNAGREPDS